tara:strand:- start:900 stop:1832 length:933 start_codon:yes stop_codon:yes gene_type:complete
MKAQAKTREDIKKNLAARAGSQRSSLITNDQCEKIIMLAPHDEGVMRNGGRRGSALGPKCVAHCFKKFSIGLKGEAKIQMIDVIDHAAADFETMQLKQTDTIAELLRVKARSSIIHIGGGHDHIYPLLAALAATSEKIIHVVNIDAHLDTRDDQVVHSGTPFRQFQELAGSRARITQIGIQDFANGAKNWDGMKMNVHSLEKLEVDTLGFSNFDRHYLDELLDIKKDELTVFSLDLDAINGFEMPAVSAVNPAGLPLMFVRALLGRYQKLMVENKAQSIAGFYELNPIYDCVSGTSAKAVAAMTLIALNS